MTGSFAGILTHLMVERTFGSHNDHSKLSQAVMRRSPLTILTPFESVPWVIKAWTSFALLRGSR